MLQGNIMRVSVSFTLCRGRTLWYKVHGSSFCAMII